MRVAADVVIIGGGCLGARVAYHFARRGVTRVVLVERLTPVAAPYATICRRSAIRIRRCTDRRSRAR